MAQMMRARCKRAVHVVTAASRELRALLTSHILPVDKRRDVESGIVNTRRRLISPQPRRRPERP